jgi:hypothetical protein
MADNKLTPQSVIVAVPGQVSSKLGEDVVILSLADGKYYGLNPVGARVWELISEPASIESVVQKMTGEYEIDADSCRKDVLDLAVQLIDQGLAVRHADHG